MVKVYFNSKAHSELVAKFIDEDMYMTCLPILKEKAAEARMTITESIRNESGL
tara:strand:- start:628 stop:786 length:159 start_codon:yes stop_codon:yes gene_type:complete